MDNIKRVRAFLLFFIVSTLIYAVYYVNMKQGESLNPRIKIERIESGIENFHLVEQKENRVGWELWSDNANITNQEKNFDLTNPRMKVYLETVEKPISISSRHGYMNSVTKEILMTKDVVARTDDGEIRTESVRWNSDEEMLVTDGLVHVTAEKFTVEGVGMRAYITKERVELLSDVRGEIFLDELPGEQKK